MQVVAPEAVGVSAERLSNIKHKLGDYVDRGKVSGFVTLVARESEVAHFETCGYRDAENKLPMERDTIFRIYSMTKPITSIALMQLYERGKFQLPQPVSRYIPAFSKTKVLSGVGFLGQQLVPQNPPMTIHHLLTHTAGLSYGFFLDTPIDEMYRNSIFRSETAALEEKINGMAELPLRFQPGSAWNYSIATDVCGYLVQVLADMPFEDYLEENIFRPLGLVDTAFHVAEHDINRFAKLYQHLPQTGGFREYKGAPNIPFHDYTQTGQRPIGRRRPGLHHSRLLALRQYALERGRTRRCSNNRPQDAGIHDPQPHQAGVAAARDWSEPSSPAEVLGSALMSSWTRRKPASSTRTATMAGAARPPPISGSTRRSSSSASS